MIASRRVLAGLLAVLGLAANQPASAQAPVPSVSLVTYGPGQVYWERFGHNALVFRDPLSGRGTSYNYGMFDFEEADFMLNFALGRMQYQIAAEDADEEIAWYRSEDVPSWNRSSTSTLPRYSPSRPTWKPTCCRKTVATPTTISHPIVRPASATRWTRCSAGRCASN